MKSARERQAALEAKLAEPQPRQTVPSAPLANPTLNDELDAPHTGELVIAADTPNAPGIVARAIRAVKSAVAGGPRLGITSTGDVVEYDPTKFVTPLEGFRYSPLTADLARRLKREAADRLRQATHALSVARQRMESLRAAAKQEGALEFFGLIDTPAPPKPGSIERVRVRALKSFRRVYERQASQAYQDWHVANHGTPWVDHGRSFTALREGVVTEIPREWLDDMVKSGHVMPAPDAEITVQVAQEHQLQGGHGPVRPQTIVVPE